MQVNEFTFVVPQLYPENVGGAEVFNYYLIEELSKCYQVNYITAIVENIKGARKINLQSRKNLFQQIEIIKELLNGSNKNIIVHSFMRTKWYYIIAYPLLSIFLGRKYVIVIHGGGMMPWKFKYPFYLYFKNAHCVFGVSQKICDEYKSRTGIEIGYLPPLIPFTKAANSKLNLREKYQIEHGANVFLVVGSLKNLKRPKLVVQAFKSLGKSFLRQFNIRCFFAGDGPLRDELEVMIQKFNLSAHIQLLGNIPRNQINELYKLSDYYIISSDFEGTPISMLEAMYNELVIIGSDVPGIESILKDSKGGILFNNSSSENLQQVIQKVLKNDMSELRNNANEFFKENYSYNKMLSSFLKNI